MTCSCCQDHGHEMLKKEDALARFVSPETKPKEEALSLSEIRKKFEGDWVAIRVTERDESGQPTKGVVIANDVNRSRLRDMVLSVKECCIFSTREPIPVMF